MLPVKLCSYCLRHVHFVSRTLRALHGLLRPATCWNAYHTFCLTVSRAYCFAKQDAQ